ncbi:MAG: hypothetical protein IJ435_04410 [Clostridia bacterium]|nr:hypothetical protein [Clostridia bacterium]
MRNFSFALVLTLCIAVLFSACTSTATDPTEQTELPTLSVEEKYSEAVGLIASSECDKAYSILKDIEAFADAKALLTNFLITEKTTATRSDGTSYTLETTSNAFDTIVKEEQLTSDGEHILNEYELDLNGVVVKSKNNSDGYVITWDYIYDENGTLVKKEGVDGSGNKGSYSYEYDENGNMVKETYKDGATTDVTTFTYDANNNLIKKEYDAPFNLYYVVEYFYNEKNQKVKTTWDDANSDSWVSEDVYGEDGNIIQNIFTEDGVVEITDFTYYPDGELLSSTTHKDNEEDFTIKYEYDTIITYAEH